MKKTFKICANIADAEITVPDELWFKDYVNAGETDIAIGDKNITFDDQISVVLTEQHFRKIPTIRWSMQTTAGSATQ